ncbi:MAG: hypothetical protein KJ062_17805 [Thermoanaerobaculia bacterium]|nr:hypothetical protein [Thermoanaerobaculia bacterium]
MKQTPNRSRPRPAEKPFSYRLVDLPALSGFSQSQWRNLIARGEVRAVRRGRMILVPRAEVLRVTGGDQ